MISSYFHVGSGVGDQLFRFITSRTIAEQIGVSHGMEGVENCKVLSFMKLPLFYSPAVYDKKWEEKCIRDENGVDVRSFDPESQFLQPNTIIDGCFEDEKYWGHNLDNIREWLKVEPLNMDDDVCAIGFRGGEYAAIPDLFLSHEYYLDAIKIMREKGVTKFEVHTDDTELAKKFFSYLGIPCVHDIGLNWRSVRYAKHLIIANSAFYIIPSLIGEAKEIIAPRYWARRNTKTWARPACYYKDKRITYI